MTPKTWDPAAAAADLAHDGRPFATAKHWGLAKSSFLDRLRTAGYDPAALIAPGYRHPVRSQFEDDCSQPENTPPERDGWRLIGATADIHEGSANCDRRAFREFQRDLYAAGGRVHVCAGDAIDGTYSSRGGQHEQTAVGIEAQTGHLLEDLEQRPGLSHWILGGNHGYTYTKSAGVVSADRYIERAALEMGRSDVHAVGMSNGTVEITGYPCIELVHHNRGKRAAHVDWLAARDNDTLPDVLIGGHYHLGICDPDYRGVWCGQPGTFQVETWFMSGSRDRHPIGGWLLESKRDGARWRHRAEFWKPTETLGRVI
jgi:hypothetical protein